MYFINLLIQLERVCHHLQHDFSLIIRLKLHFVVYDLNCFQRMYAFGLFGFGQKRLKHIKLCCYYSSSYPKFIILCCTELSVVFLQFF